MPTAVKVDGRPRVDTDFMFESTQDVAGYCMQCFVMYTICLLTQVIYVETRLSSC